MKFIFKIVILLAFIIGAKFANAQLALEFDGSNEYVTIGNVADLNFERTDAFTIEGWSQWNSNFGMVFSKMNNAAPYTGYEVYINNDGTIWFYLINTFGSNYIHKGTTVAHFSDNQYHHFAVTYDGSSNASGVNIYIDGVSVGSTVLSNSLTGSIITPAPVLMGNRSPGLSLPFNGQIDEVRVWNIERTAAEILAIVNACNLTDPNIIAYYDMENGSGSSIATDISGNGNDGTLTNMEIATDWVVSPIACSRPSVAGEARIILNNISFIVMNDTVIIVVENENPNAITETNGGGMIVSENESNELIWHVNENVGGTYVVPFGTKPVVQGGNGTKIPVSVAIDTAGIQSTSGSIAFSTWETPNDDNTPYPWSVTNAEDGLKAIDRYWGLFPENFTSNPAVKIEFTYDDNANEIGGTNTLVEANLVAQYYDNSVDLWQNTLGIVDTANRIVNGISLNTTDFNIDNWLWTLVDVNSPLPIDLKEFTSSCFNNSPHLEWENSNNSYAEIFVENSISGNKWIELDNVTDKISWSSIGEEEGNFYRLKFVSETGVEYSQIQKIDCKSANFDVIIYPNPATNVVYMNIQGSEKTSLNIYESTGKLVKQHQLGSVLNHTLDVSNLSRGMYYFKFSNEEGTIKSFKLNLIK